MNILICNMSKFVNEEQLSELFRPFGTVSSSSIVMDKVTGESKRFGFVEMPNQEEAEAAMKALHHTKMLKKTIRVKKAALQTKPVNSLGQNKPLTTVTKPLATPAAQYKPSVRTATPSYKASRPPQSPSKPEHKPRREQPSYTQHSLDPKNRHPFARYQKQKNSSPASAPRNGTRQK